MNKVKSGNPDSYYQGGIFEMEELLIQNMEHDNFIIDIIILNDSVHVYLVSKINDCCRIYITDLKNKNHKPELLKSFASRKDALQFSIEFWSKRKKVINYKKRFMDTKDKPATSRQFEATNGMATTQGNTTWYFARATCIRRLIPILNELQGEEVKQKASDFELFKVPENL